MTRTLALLLTLTTTAHAEPPRARDGDDLVVDGQRYRICGVQAEEYNTRAGRAAHRALQRIIAGKAVICVPVGEGSVCDGRSKRRSFDRIVATCYANGVDVAGEMVRQGHAVDWPRYSGGYYAPPN